MVKTASTMLPLGSVAPEFSLLNVIDGNTLSLSSLPADKPLLMMFVCNHCPYVVHLRDALVSFATEYQAKGLTVVAISSNDVENYPQDSPEKMKEEADSFRFPYPYLYDADQAVAKAYQAACTPDFFLFDADKKLAYRGQFDSSRPGNAAEITGSDLKAACEAVLSGEEVNSQQTPSLGCNIKWIDAPNYFTGQSAE